MDNVAYIALSRQMAMQRQLDVVANNLANMNTTAFRGENILFEEYLVDTGGRKSSFVQDWGMLRDTREGELRPTGNPLDIGISGRGFLTVETPDGPRYTRNGQMRLSSDGQLLSNEMLPVLDGQGRPIQLDPRDGTPVINRDGTISTPRGGQIARIELVQFDNEQALKKTQGSLMDPGGQEPKPAESAIVVQGMAESSNVTPILEMTRMIELSRSYQHAQKVLEADHDRQRKAIQALGQVA